MSSAGKRKGSQWERDTEEHANTSGLKARRLPRAGSKDIGDVAIEGKAFDIIVECKNVKTPSMAQWLKEADIEACNYELKYDKPTIGVVLTKTRRAGTGEGRVTMTYDMFINLLRWGGVA